VGRRAYTSSSELNHWQNGYLLSSKSTTEFRHGKTRKLARGTLLKIRTRDADVESQKKRNGGVMSVLGLTGDGSAGPSEPSNRAPHRAQLKPHTSPPQINFHAASMAYLPPTSPHLQSPQITAQGAPNRGLQLSRYAAFCYVYQLMSKMRSTGQQTT